MSKYPYDSRPGSAWMDEREERAQRFATIQPTAPKPTRAERLKADPDAWETMAEPWETAEPVTHECANCGLTAHHSEMQEAERRCGTGYGEWYCAHGHGCQE